MLRATTAYTFSNSEFPKAFRHRCFWHFDFQKCFAPQWRAIFHFSSPKMAPHFSEPTFRSSQNIGKNTVFGAFLPFLCALILFLPFSSLICFLLPFSSLTLPSSAFPCVHIVGSLTSKLPFNTKMNNNHNDDANVNNMKVDNAKADNTNIANSPVVILMRFTW